MADDPDNLVLELLRRMREDMNAIKSDMVSVKLDMGSMKSEMSLMKSDVHSIRRDVHSIKHVQVSHSLKLDYLEENFEIMVEGTKLAMSGSANATGRRLRTDKLLAELAQSVAQLERAG